MQDIEFRVWDKIDKSYYCALVALYFENAPQGVCAAYFINSLGDEKIVQNEGQLVIEQYTGMKDQDGNKIFEGDCVGTKDNYTKGNYVEKYADTWCINGDVPLADWLSNPDNKVIGNIHEEDKIK